MLTKPSEPGYIVHRHGEFLRDTRVTWGFVTGLPTTGAEGKKADVVIRDLLSRGNLRFYNETGAEGHIELDTDLYFADDSDDGGSTIVWWIWGDLEFQIDNWLDREEERD